MDVMTLIFLVAAVIIFFRLRKVLGQRTGHERNPFEKKWPVIVREVKKAKTQEAEPTKPLPVPAKAEMPAKDALEGIEPGSALVLPLKAIADADPAFNVKHFLKGAKAAYELVLASFAKGDREKMRKLLSTEIYENFDEEISVREKNGENVDFHFIGIDKAELVQAVLKGKLAQISVRFNAKLVQATRNAKGEVIEGDATAIDLVSDIWTFERQISSRDPNWKLIAAEDE